MKTEYPHTTGTAGSVRKRSNDIMYLMIYGPVQYISKCSLLQLEVPETEVLVKSLSGMDIKVIH